MSPRPQTRVLALSRFRRKPKSRNALSGGGGGGNLAMMTMELAGQDAADIVEFRARHVARTGQRQGVVALDAAGAGRHHDDAACEEDRLLDRVRHEHDSKFRALPDLQQLVLQALA